MIRISEFSRKELIESFVSSNTSTALNETRNGIIPKLSKIEIFSKDVVDPFTENPFAINDFAKGNPNQPQPKMLICFIYAEFIYFTVISFILSSVNFVSASQFAELF